MQFIGKVKKISTDIIITVNIHLNDMFVRALSDTNNFLMIS